MAAQGTRPGRTIGVVSIITAAGAGVVGTAARLPVTVVAPVMIVVLAGIDILGAVVAKAWSDDRAPWLFAVGAALFVLLFWIYGVSLSYGHLSTITLGWVVLVTVASIGLDATVYDVHVPARKWLAAVAVIGLLVYLMTDDRSGAADVRPHSGPTAARQDPAAGPTVGSIDDLRSHVNRSVA